MGIPFTMFFFAWKVFWQKIYKSQEKEIYRKIWEKIYFRYSWIICRYFPSDKNYSYSYSQVLGLTNYSYSYSNRSWLHESIPIRICGKNNYSLITEIWLQKQVINKNCTINEQKMVHFQDAFTDLYDNILVMTWTLCMPGEHWILGFIWPKKIMVTQNQPKAMTFVLPDTTWYPWFDTVSYIEVGLVWHVFSSIHMK